MLLGVSSREGTPTHTHSPRVRRHENGGGYTARAMADAGPGEVTVLLRRVADGDAEARAQLAEIVYRELRAMAARQLRGMRGATLLLNATNGSARTPAEIEQLLQTSTVQ